MSPPPDPEPPTRPRKSLDAGERPQGQKQGKKGGKQGGGKNKPPKQPKQPKNKKQPKAHSSEQQADPRARILQIFNIPQQQLKKGSVACVSHSTGYGFRRSVVHPSFHRLAVQIAHGKLFDSNDRIVLMLEAYRDLFRDYIMLLQNAARSRMVQESQVKVAATPDGSNIRVEDEDLPSFSSIREELQQTMSRNLQHLIAVDPMTAGMGHFHRKLKALVFTKKLADLNSAEALRRLCHFIENTVGEGGTIETTGKIIAHALATKVHDGDKVLTFGYSKVILDALTKAHGGTKKRKRFAVIVAQIDSGSHKSLEMARRLAEYGIEVSVTYLSSIAYVIKDVNSCFLPAESATTGGTILSFSGSAAIACFCHKYRVPVVVACETFKFSEKNSMDVFSHFPPTAQWEQEGNQRFLSLNCRGDLIPNDLVTLLIVERGVPGCIPATGVQVLYREQLTNIEEEL